MSNSITQDMWYWRSFRRHVFKYGVSCASWKYNKNRSFAFLTARKIRLLALTWLLTGDWYPSQILRLYPHHHNGKVALGGAKAFLWLEQFLLSCWFRCVAYYTSWLSRITYLCGHLVGSLLKNNIRTISFFYVSRSARSLTMRYCSQSHRALWIPTR